MRVTGRIALAVTALAAVGAAVLAGRWYETKRTAPQASADNLQIDVTNPADGGPGSLREALFIAASAPRRATIVVKVAHLQVRTTLPPLVSAHGILVQSQPAGSSIEAGGLSSGPVFDVAGPDVSIEALRITHCPAAAVLVRAVRFRLESVAVDGCDVGVDVAENASNTLIVRSQFNHDRLGIRVAAAGANSAIEQNAFSQNKDAGLWAVRGDASARGDPINVHDNRFTNETAGVVAGNIPILVERNDFAGAREAAVHIVGADAVIRANRISGGESMGIVLENARDAVVEGNEIDAFKAYGIMVRGSANALLRGNRIHKCGYGIAFVLGDPRAPSTAVDNTIMEPAVHGIDVLGDSPVLRHNTVLHPHGVALHVEGFQPPGGAKITSRPFLDNNNFGDSSIAEMTSGFEQRVSR